MWLNQLAWFESAANTGAILRTDFLYIQKKVTFTTVPVHFVHLCMFLYLTNSKLSRSIICG